MRNKDDVSVCYSCTNLKNSWCVRGIRYFNMHPKHAKETPLKKFKLKLFDWLVINPFYSFNECLKHGFNTDLS